MAREEVRLDIFANLKGAKTVQKQMRQNTAAAKKMQQEISGAVSLDTGLRGFSVLKNNFSVVRASATKYGAVSTAMFKKQQKAAQLGARAISQVTKSYNRASVAAKDVQKENMRFKAELLSVMFLGMAMQRVFGGFLSSAFQVFKKVTEGTEMANNGVTRLNAAWQFFKFSLINAIMQSGFFQWMIQKLISIVDWFNGLSDTTKGWLAVLIGVVAAIGGFFTLLGIVGLGVTQIGAGLAVWGSIITGVFRSLKDMTKWLAAIKWTALWGVSAPLLILTGIIMAIAFIGLLIKRVGGFGEFFKAILRGLIRAFGAWAQGITNLMGPVFDWMIDALISVLNIVRRIVSAFDRVMGTNLSSMLPSVTEVNRLAEQITKTNGFRELAEVFLANSKFLKQKPENTYSGFSDLLSRTPLASKNQQEQQTKGEVSVVQQNQIFVEGEEVKNQTNDKLNDQLQRLGLGEYADIL